MLSWLECPFIIILLPRCSWKNKKATLFPNVPHHSTADRVHRARCRGSRIQTTMPLWQVENRRELDLGRLRQKRSPDVARQPVQWNAKKWKTVLMKTARNCTESRRWVEIRNIWELWLRPPILLKYPRKRARNLWVATQTCAPKTPWVRLKSAKTTQWQMQFYVQKTTIRLKWNGFSCKLPLLKIVLKRGCGLQAGTN